jgi:peptide deformylase
MAILEILQYPDPRLNTPAERVEKIDAGTRRLIDDMVETMYAAPGVGLAATQVNVHKQLIVIDVSEDRSDLRVFVNPEITRREGVAVNQEGCLSIPGIYDNVERAESVTVTASIAMGPGSPSMPRECSPPASSTRWITSMARSSSTTSRSSSRTVCARS